jgi:hypothetical protein
MKRKVFFQPCLVLATMLFGFFLLLPATNVLACGNGLQGGADYAPQRRGAAQQQIVKGQPISADQAQNIVINYVKPINPGLTVGTANDVGAYYEVVLLSKDGETVQVIGVDKYTGQMEPLS